MENDEDSRSVEAARVHADSEVVPPADVSPWLVHHTFECDGPVLLALLL